MENPRLDDEYTAKLCFACSQNNPIGLKLKPVHDGEKVTAKFTAGKFHQGWNDMVHGGILYTLLDEVTAYAMLCHGIELGVTAKSEIRFRQVAPISEPIRASAWVTKLTKRLVEAKGVISLKDNTVIADGSFLFYVLRQSRKAILWDMDGVISDSYSFHFAAWQETFAKRGIEFAKKDFTSTRSIPGGEIWLFSLGGGEGGGHVVLVGGEPGGLLILLPVKRPEVPFLFTKADS
jgi:acyl-coenzyme A thioesterase PaaI-like protein